MIRFEVYGIDEMIGYIAAVTHVGYRTVGRLEATLHRAFEDTQERVHVVTGSLRGSGKTSSEFDGAGWAGVIEYGGSSSGFVNDPVEYAQYEMARGGDHDFFAGLPLYEEQLLEATATVFDVG